MMTVPVFLLDADRRGKYKSPVFNRNEVQSFLYVHIPLELSAEFKLFQLDATAPKHQRIECFTEFIYRDYGKPYFKIKTENLDLTIGLHTYMMSLVNIRTNDVISLYFSYIIQDDNPDTPYIYMKREEEEEE